MLKENLTSWPKSHLNWAAIIITFGGLIFTYLVAILGLSFNLFSLPQLLPLEFKIYLSLTVVIATMVSFIGILWLIINKHRHWAFILFFIPSALYSLLLLPMLFSGALLENSLFHNGASFLAILSLFFLIPAGFWLIGLIVILLLKKKEAETVQLSIDPLLEIQNENKVNRRDAPLRQMLNSKLFRVSGSLLVLAIIISGVSCVRMNTGYQTVTIKNDNASGDENLHYSQFSFECPKSYYFPNWRSLIRYPGYETTLGRDRIKLFSLETSSIQINISPYPIIQKDNPVSSSLAEQCIHFYYQTLCGLIPAKDSIGIKDLKITSTTVHGISADYAVCYFDNSKPHVVGGGLYIFNDMVELVCFEREGIIWTIQINANRVDSISYSDMDHIVKSFKITP